MALSDVLVCIAALSQGGVPCLTRRRSSRSDCHKTAGGCSAVKDASSGSMSAVMDCERRWWISAVTPMSAHIVNRNARHRRNSWGGQLILGTNSWLRIASPPRNWFVLGRDSAGRWMSARELCCSRRAFRVGNAIRCVKHSRTPLMRRALSITMPI